MFEISERKHLKSTTIREDREIDIHEFMESAKSGYELMSGTEIEVIGIGEDDLTPNRLDLISIQSLDGRLCANRHKYRCFDVPMGRRKYARSGVSICGFYCKFKHILKNYLKIIFTTS